MRSIVAQLSKLVRPTSLTYIFTTMSPGYSSCLWNVQNALTITTPCPCGSGWQPIELTQSMRTVSR